MGSTWADGLGMSQWAWHEWARPSMKLRLRPTSLYERIGMREFVWKGSIDETYPMMSCMSRWARHESMGLTWVSWPSMKQGLDRRVCMKGLNKCNLPNDVILALFDPHSGLTQLALFCSCIRLGRAPLDGLAQLALFYLCIKLAWDSLDRLDWLALFWSCITLGQTPLDGLTQWALFFSCITLGRAPLHFPYLITSISPHFTHFLFISLCWACQLV